MLFFLKKIILLTIIFSVFIHVSMASEIEVYLTFQNGSTELAENSQNNLQEVIAKFDANNKISISFYYETYSTEMEMQQNFLYGKITQNVMKFAKSQVANIALEKTDYLETNKFEANVTKVLVVVEGTEIVQRQQIFAYNSAAQNENVLKLPASTYIISPTAHAVVEEASATLSATTTEASETQEEELIIDDVKALFLSPTSDDNKTRPIYH